MKKSTLLLTCLSLFLFFSLEIRGSNPIVTPMSPVTICIGSCIALSATASGGTPPYTYTWTLSGTPINSPVCPLVTTTYTIIATDNGGLSSAPALVTITVNPPLEVISSASSAVCQGSNVQLNASASGGNGTYTYTWTPSAGLSNPNIPNPVASPTISTTYTVEVSDNCGTPVDSAMTSVNEYPGSTYSLLVDDSICIPDNVYFWLSNSTVPCNVGVWNFGDGSSATSCPPELHTYTVAGNYTVTFTMTDIHGCQSSRSTQVLVHLCTGIKDPDPLSDSFKLYPIPFSGELSLRFEKINQERTVQIYDILGKEVFHSQITEMAADLDLTRLPSGIFFLQVSSGQERILRKISKE